MGLLSNLAGAASKASGPPAPLAHPGKPIGVLPAFTQHQQQMVLKVRERKLSLSGDDFSVKDAFTGQKIFEVDGKMVSMHSKKDIKDARGTKLFTLKKKLVAIHATYDGVSPENGNTLFTIKGGFGLGAKLNVTFNNAAGTGEAVHLQLKGDWFDRRASITTETGVPVAHISRSFANAGQIIADQQTYFLASELLASLVSRFAFDPLELTNLFPATPSVAPGVDAALLLAICVALDETENEKN